MTRKMKKNIAGALVFVMVITSVLGFSATSKAAGIDFPLHKLIQLDQEYSGTLTAVADIYNPDVLAVEYFNIFDEEYEAGDQYFISFTVVSGLEDYRQIAVQSSLDQWAWSTAPKLWANGGIADGTQFSGIITATDSNFNDPNIALKLHIDNIIAGDVEDTEIVLDDFMITSFSKAADAVNTWDGISELEYGTKYTADVTAVYNDNMNAHEVYLPISSDYEEGDQFVIFCTVEGAGDFRQASLQTSMDGFSWHPEVSVWSEYGIPDGQVVGGLFTATTDAPNYSSLAKIQLDNSLSLTGGDTEITISITITIKIKRKKPKATAQPETNEQEITIIK